MLQGSKLPLGGTRTGPVAALVRLPGTHLVSEN